MKKLFSVKLPTTILFEDLDSAVWFAKLLANARTTGYESVYSSNARDGRNHYINYTKPIDLNINFQAVDYLENKWEAIEKMALYTASQEELEKRQAMTEEERKIYMKNLVDTTKSLDDTSYPDF